MKNKHWLIVMALLSCLGCEPFIEPDITQKEVTVFGPADQDTTEFTPQSFWWEEMDDAQEFRFQIVSPSFENPIQLFRDSLVRDNRVSISLEPGAYEWQVRGENSESETPWTKRSIYVLPNGDLTTQELVLSSPLDRFLVGDTSNIRLTWDKILTAKNYQLIVVRGTFDSYDLVLIDNPSLTSNSFTIPYINTFNQKETYSWRVRATNDKSSTNFSTERLFYVDSTNAYVKQ